MDASACDCQTKAGTRCMNQRRYLVEVEYASTRSPEIAQATVCTPHFTAMRSGYTVKIGGRAAAFRKRLPKFDYVSVLV